MNTIQIVTLLATVITAGWFAAFIVQLIKRPEWPSWVKLVISIVVSALVGLGTAWLSGDLTHFVTVWKQGAVTSDQVLNLAVLVFTSAQIWYHKFWPEQGWAQTLGLVGSKASK